MHHTQNSDLPEEFFEYKMSQSAVAQFLYTVEHINQCIALAEQITRQMVEPNLQPFTSIRAHQHVTLNLVNYFTVDKMQQTHELLKLDRLNVNDEERQICYSSDFSL